MNGMGWTALSSITEIVVAILTLLTIIIAFYQLIDDKKTKIGVFSFFNEGEYSLKYHDKVYKMHCNKKYFDIMNLQARKNSIRIVFRNKSNYPIEIFKYTVYARRNIVIHLFLCCMRKIFKIDYELCQKREFFIDRKLRKISLTPNETKIKYISLNKFQIPDILYYKKFAKIILSSMKLIIQIECYPKEIKKKLGFSLYKIEKEFEKTYRAAVGISYYINGDDSLKQ